MSLILLLLSACASADAWSGPTVAPAFSPSGVSALKIDGAVSAAQWFVGNTQGGLDDDYASWGVELKHAAAAGVRIFGVCTDGSDLLGQPAATLANKTREMVQRVLDSVPAALIMPRVPIGAWLGAGSTLQRVALVQPNGSAAPGPGYGAITDEWIAASAQRLQLWLKELDAAYPGRIAGVHLAGLAAGEMRYAQPPETLGYADYATSTTAQFCSGRGADCIAATADDRTTPPDGNLFISNASASYNLFLSRQVQRAISANAAAAKNAMQGKGLVITFYGYLNELGGHRASGSGHLALTELLADLNVDGVASPYKYDMLYRQPTGPFATMGPADALRLAGKMWVSEDDTRTSLVCGAGVKGCADAPPGWLACSTTGCDVKVLKRNIMTSALHGGGHYAFDLRLGGWFGKAGGGTNASATAAIWGAVKSARAAVERGWRADTAVLKPEVAVFTDDESLAHLRADGIGTMDATLHPAEWLDDMQVEVAALGAPVRHYLLRDLLRPDAATAFGNVKLALLPNAFAMDAVMTAAVATLAQGNRTLVSYYAPAAVDVSALASAGSAGLEGAAARVSAMTGCPMVRGKGSHSLQSEFVQKTGQNTDVNGGCAGLLGALKGSRYGPTASLNPAPAGTGPSSVLDPFFTLDETANAAADAGSQCAVLARLYVGDDGKTQPAAATCSGGGGGGRSVFSSAPFGWRALRLIAQAAGVHLFLDTVAGLPVNSSCPCAAGGNTAATRCCVRAVDGIELSGSALILRGGGAASNETSRVVTLPPRAGEGEGKGGWEVKDEKGAVVCKGCASFRYALGAGESSLYTVS